MSEVTKDQLNIPVAEGCPFPGGLGVNGCKAYYDEHIKANNLEHLTVPELKREIKALKDRLRKSLKKEPVMKLDETDSTKSLILINEELAKRNHYLDWEIWNLHGVINAACGMLHYINIEGNESLPDLVRDQAEVLQDSVSEFFGGPCVGDADDYLNQIGSLTEAVEKLESALFDVLDSDNLDKAHAFASEALRIPEDEVQEPKEEDKPF